MKLRPLSGTIYDAVGRTYFGHNGSTFLLDLNSLTLGLAPSISSISNGFDVLFICFTLLGNGSI